MDRRHHIPSPPAICAMLLALLLIAVNTPSLSAETTPLAYTMNNYQKSSIFTAETYWKATYPVFSGSPAAAAINRTLLYAVTGNDPSKPQSAPVTLNAAASSFIKDFEDMRKEMPDVMPYQWETTGTVMLNRSGVLTVSLSTNAYTGGAHGSYNTEYFVFDAETGKRLKIADVFIPGYEVSLDALIDTRFRETKGLTNADPLNGEKGGLFEDVIRHNENFAVTDQGITFFYNPYEIAPFSEGPTEINLTWQEVNPLLRP